MRSYPSWIGELRRKSPVGIERCRYAREHLEPGKALVLFRERAEPGDKHASLIGIDMFISATFPGDTVGLSTRLMTGFASLPSSKPSKLAGFSAGALHPSARGLSFSTMAVSECRSEGAWP